MKSIYVVFFSTDLRVGRFIRTMTRQKYNHVSISIDGLKTLCSFSRLYLAHPMIGGFVEESPKRYLMSDKTLVKIVRIYVEDYKYALTEYNIRKMQKNPEAYVYNFLSFAGYAMGKRVKRDKAYTCVEFVRDTLACAGIVFTDNSSCIRIKGLEEELDGYESMEGTAQELLLEDGWGNDIYLENCGSRISVAKEAARRFVHMLRNC